MTTKSPDAIALGRIRQLASQSSGGVAKTPQQMRLDLAAISVLADDAIMATPPPALPPPVVPPPALPPPVIPPVVQPPVIVVPPAQPPAPVPTPTPSPAPPGSSVVFREDFTGFATDAAFRSALPRLAGAAGTSQKPHLIHLDTAVLYDGHPTMRYDMFADTAETPKCQPMLAAPLDDVWFRAVIRFSPGFTTTGTLVAANSYKLLALGFVPVTDPAGARHYGRSTVEITNTTAYKFGGGRDPGGVPIAWTWTGPVTDEWTSGAWYDYIIHYARTSPTSAVLRHWRNKDGQPPRLVATVKLAADPAQSWAEVPRIQFVSAGLNFNQVRRAAQALWYGLIDVRAGGDPWGIA